jgi:alpha-beta hydrolase superfamily lysophospholipase
VGPQAALCAGFLFVIAALCGTSHAQDELPAPETVSLDAKDGALIACTWYPSPKAEEEGKTVVPVIILHGWGGARSQYDALATSLQGRGHAVAIPDLRGHGSSTVIKRPNQNQDSELKIDNGKAKLDGRTIPAKYVVDAMWRYDVEAVKKFLMQKNNDGEVNIELLCVVGVEEGALVAINWVALDWSWPTLAARKQGKDVKAMALVSPVTSFEGVTATNALKSQQVPRDLSAMIIVGSLQGRVYQTARRLYQQLKQGRPPTPENEAERRAKQTLWLIEMKTVLQGQKLIDREVFAIDKKIAGFIHFRLVNKADQHPWKDRS